MIPVFQTRFGKPHGNCHAACLASILHVPLDEVPTGLFERKDWQDVINAYLRPMNLGLVVFDYTEGETWWIPPGVFHVLSGPSPRGDFWHSVVGRDGVLVHDPHPSGAGLVGTEREVQLFVTLDPSPASRNDPLLARRGA